MPKCSAVVFNVHDMVTGWDRMRELADSEDHIVPGHDPAVLVRYPAYSHDLRGAVCKLHLAPAESTRNGAVRQDLFEPLR